MRNKLIWLLVIAALLAVSFAVQTNAEKARGDIVVAKGQTVKNAVAINGDVIVCGHVTEDAVAVMGDVRIKPGGIVDGDATAAAGKVIKEPGGIVRGTVSSHTAQTNTSGKGKHKIGDVTIAKGQTVRDANAVKGDLTIYGHITGDANAVMGDIHVKPGGTVDGDANAVMGNIYVEKGGRIERDAYAVSGKVVQQGGSVGGDIGSIDIPIPRWLMDRISEPATWTAFFWIYWTLGLLFHALLATVVVALWPSRTQTVATTALGRPGWSLLYGFIGVMAIVPVFVLLLVTCVGIPFIPVEFALVWVMWIFGAIGMKLALGQKIIQAFGRSPQSLIWPVLIGVVLFRLIRLIPFFVGESIVMFLVLFGFGAVIITGFGTSADWFSRKFSKAGAPPQVPPAPPPTVPPTTPESTGGTDAL